MAACWGNITIMEIASAMGGTLVSGTPDKYIQGISTDSRNIEKGDIFLALKGEIYDGHNFLKDAVNGGASGVIVEEDTNIGKPVLENYLAVISVPSTLKALGDLASWWRKQWGGRLIGITGSNGKTTTKEITASILSLGRRTMKSPGNFNNLVGLPLSILSLNFDHQQAVLEMGMNRPGEIARLTQIAGPDIAVITNTAKVHLEGVGDFKGVAKAKGEMLEMMPGDSTAVLNGDDESYPVLARLFPGNIVSFGLGRKNHVRAENISLIENRSQAFDICIDDKRFRVKINIPGVHNVYNALAGASVANCLSLPEEMISLGLERFVPLEGRFQISNLDRGISLIDDTYNSNPSSLAAALKTVRDIAGSGKDLIVGLGEMMELGAEAPELHFQAGEMIAKAGAGYLVVMGQHGPNVLDGARKGGMKPGLVKFAVTHSEMADAIKANAKEADIIFLKGSRKAALDRVAKSVTEYFGSRGLSNAL